MSDLREQWISRMSSLCLGVVMALGICGCEKKQEKVLDIKTPGMNLEVNKSEDGSKVEIKKEIKETPQESRSEP